MRIHAACSADELDGKRAPAPLGAPCAAAVEEMQREVRVLLLVQPYYLPTFLPSYLTALLPYYLTALLPYCLTALLPYYRTTAPTRTHGTSADQLSHLTYSYDLTVSCDREKSRATLHPLACHTTPP